MAAEVKLSAGVPAGQVVYPASVVGAWTVIHTNLSSTAETAAVLKRPATYAGTGITITLTTTATDDKIRDNTYRYSDCYDIAGTDLIGAKWIVALTETAASISGGADTTVALMAMALN